MNKTVDILASDAFFSTGCQYVDSGNNKQWQAW